MRKISILSLSMAAAALIAASCQQPVSNGRPPVAVVQNILSGDEAQLRAVVENYKAPIYADINVIDSPERAVMLTEALITSDRYDNIDAAERQDNLPDFAGERIVAQMDIARDAYSQLDSITLREIAVRSTIAAMDKRLCVASYDTEYRSNKPSSKMVIISSPELEAFAAYDIDTLKASMGISLPVVYPARLMLKGLYDEGARNIGIIVNGLTSLSGAYDSMCEEISADGEAMNCYVVSDDDLGGIDPLRDFLRSYIDAGNSAALDAIVLDCFEYNPEDMLTEYASLLLEDAEENLSARSAVSSSLNIVSIADTITEEAYRIMRERNLFTHDIRYPVAAAYLTNPEMFQYALMQFDWNALPTGLESDIMNAAPKTYISYVQDQYIPGGN